MMKQQKQYREMGRRIRKARREAHLSQKELGDYLKVSDKTISSYEVGRTVPSFDALRRISKVCHKPITYFADEEISRNIDLEIEIKTVEKELLEMKKELRRRKRKK